MSGVFGNIVYNCYLYLFLKKFLKHNKLKYERTKGIDLKKRKKERNESLVSALLNTLH